MEISKFQFSSSNFIQHLYKKRCIYKQINHICRINQEKHSNHKVHAKPKCGTTRIFSTTLTFSYSKSLTNRLRATNKPFATLYCSRNFLIEYRQNAISRYMKSRLSAFVLQVIFLPNWTSKTEEDRNQSRPSSQ